MLSQPRIDEESPLFRLDPRLKIIAAVAFSFAVALAGNFAVAGAGLCLGLLLAGLAHLSPKPVLSQLAAVNGFNLFLWITLPLTYNGSPTFTLGPLTATEQGIRLAAMITVKSNSVVLLFLALISPISPMVLGHTLNRLGLPDRLVHLLLMSYRYLFVIEAEYRRLSRSARVRGFSPGTNLHTYRTFANLVGMVLVRASVRGERVRRAMLCRGFSGRYVGLHRFQWRGADTLASALLVGAYLFLLVLEWGVVFP